jgi:hypothetical protein
LAAGFGNIRCRTDLFPPLTTQSGQRFAGLKLSTDPSVSRGR